MTIYGSGKFLPADVLVFLLVTKKGCRILAFFCFFVVVEKISCITRVENSISHSFA
jgi:hypothetical protein